MSKNPNAYTLHDGDAEIVGQIQAGTVAVQNAVLASINNKLAVDGSAVITEAQKNALNGYAGLDANGKLLASVIPNIGISSVSVVASESAQLGLDAKEGDIAVRTDEGKTYIHNGGTAGTMADWTYIASPTNVVQSVAGKTGNVTLVAADITDLDSALSGKANTVHTHSLAAITDAGTAASKDVASAGNASSTQVVKGDDTRLSDSRTPTAHTHATADITGLDTALQSGMTAITGINSTISTMQTDIAGKANTVHTHAIADVTGLQTALDSKPASSHTHTLSNITDAGNAASRSVASSGDATSSQVVLGNDTRLTNSRTPTAHKSTHASTGGANEKQLITVAGNTGSGSFTLTFNGQTTDPISVPATTSSITAALEGLSNVGVGDVTVTSFFGQTFAFEVLFVNALGNTNHGLMTSNDSGITGGGSVYIQGTDPGTATTPSTWINTSDNNTYVWNGSSWGLFGPTPAYESVSTSQRKVVVSSLIEGQSIGSDPIYPSDIGAASSVHTHAISDVTNLQTTLDGKASSSHTHSIANVTDLQTTLDGKASTGHQHEKTGGLGIGTNALSVATTGEDNVAVGAVSLSALTEGLRNTAIGPHAGGSITTGDDNTAVGYYALSSLTTGNNNIAIGKQALDNVTTTSSNVAIGINALGIATGGGNTAIGAALTALTSGSGNVAVGPEAGDGVTTGSNNTFMGSGATATSNISNSTGIGYDVDVTASNQVVIGNASVTQTKLEGEIVVGSGTEGGLTLPIATGGGGVTLSWSHHTVLVNTTTEINLPSASTCTGREYIIKNVGTGTVTIDPNGTQTIDGATTHVLDAQWEYVRIQSDGANWVII